jgi:hypothetical protein
LINLEISTILSNRTKEGMINFVLKPEDGEEVKTQWDIAKAKEIHRMLGEAIEAAVSDTLIYKFMREKIGMDEVKASMVLMDFRELRQGTKGIVFPF